jgi:methionyl aminopeptidase
MNKKVNIKTPEEIQIMAEGGAKLARVKAAIMEKIEIGVNGLEIENLATELIKKEGAEPSFKMVPGYSWSTCVNVNEGIVHGIPKKETVFKKGDLVSVDLGIYFKGFHTDTSISKALKSDDATSRFLKVGKDTLKKAISQAVVGNKIEDISRAIQESVESAGYRASRSLVGHGIGRDLHEYPAVPCFVDKNSEDFFLKEGLVIAIEVMYTMGKEKLMTESDGWTIRTKDGKIAGLFEDTVAITADGPVILTT